MSDLATISELGKAVYADSENVIRAMATVEQAPCPVFHRFAPGLYIREVHFPAGALAVGHIQKFDHLNVFIKGKVRMLNPDGSTTDLCAPMTFVGKPGRKFGVVLEDVIWQNIYPTTETDIDKLEEMFLEKPFDLPEKQPVALLEDRSDYARMIAEVGMTEEQVQQEVTCADDLMSMPYNWSKAVVRNSPIHGKGLFATVPVLPGQTIAPANIGGKRTPAGRYTNHSANPNAEMVKGADGNLYLIAVRTIRGCLGGDSGEEVTVDYRKSFALSRKEQSCRQQLP